DTPGFIANRIGVFWLQCAVAEAIALRIPIEEADAVLGAPAGAPRTGVFGLLDLVGLDLMPHVVASLDATLPADDPIRDCTGALPLVNGLIERGYTGRKGKGGFYRLQQVDGQRQKQALNLQTGEYAASRRPRLASVEAARRGGLRALFESRHRSADYAWRVLSRTLCYAASLVPGIADDIVSVDTAMRLGYNWKRGPFELIDDIGASWLVERLHDEGRSVPALLASATDGFYRQTPGPSDRPVASGLSHLDVSGQYRPVEREDGVLLLADIKRRGGRLAGNASASLWDIGEGVVCLEFHTKMNALDPQVLETIHEALRIVPNGHRALVIHNDADNFSVGVNLGLALFALNIAAWDEVERIVQAGQQAYLALRQAPFPVIGAPSGMALGGGCEILLHCDAVVAHAETYMGLVESGVGLVPGWGGCTAMLRRWYTYGARPAGPMPALSRVFELISLATVARSAHQAIDHLFLRCTDSGPDEIVMNRDRLLARARRKALSMSDGYAPPEPTRLRLPGASARAAMRLAVHGFQLQGKATAHDAEVADGLAEVLSGGETDWTECVDEPHLLALERAVFMRLARTPATLARIEHMLETGRPLRN
ncbi:MAG: enoyl-CoA hydratase/isomerase family protein, partial [Gammaproteobacteria bacterium]|nr:enoyl-CoA hydratase/isomerase family protein [Gammaproteobacteria bacterium]